VTECVRDMCESFIITRIYLAGVKNLLSKLTLMLTVSAEVVVFLLCSLEKFYRFSTKTP